MSWLKTQPTPPALRDDIMQKVHRSLAPEAPDPARFAEENGLQIAEHSRQPGFAAVVDNRGEIVLHFPIPEQVVNGGEQCGPLQKLRRLFMGGGRGSL